MELSLQEKKLLQSLFIERLLHDWSIYDNSSITSEREVASAECRTIRDLARKFNIGFPEDIAGRFI